MFYAVKCSSRFSTTGKIKSDTFVILLYNTIIEVTIFITFDTILFYPGYHQIRVNTLKVLILTNSVSNKSEALNQSRGSDALHLEILPVSNSSSSTNLSLDEKRSHFRQVFNSNKGGRDSLDYVFETVRREICQLTGKRIIEKPDDSLYPFQKPKHDNCDDGDLNSSHNPSKKSKQSFFKQSFQSSKWLSSEQSYSSISKKRKQRKQSIEVQRFNYQDFKYNRLLSAGENNKKDMCICLIDFGFSIQTYDENMFREEKAQLERLLEYMM
ncbi:unnamed protein product [Rhizophagus irregularis]|uniref:Uncharacterized protein n=1 Tax=Rhizophagus irregularis TaxID=588596 RepID=A0A915YUR8_9GLOM|nr:unnamed protein product [Rhizophagus irregularis]